MQFSKDNDFLQMFTAIFLIFLLLHVNNPPIKVYKVLCQSVFVSVCVCWRQLLNCLLDFFNDFYRAFEWLGEQNFGCHQLHMLLVIGIGKKGSKKKKEKKIFSSIITDYWNVFFMAYVVFVTNFYSCIL